SGTKSSDSLTRRTGKTSKIFGCVTGLRPTLLLFKNSIQTPARGVFCPPMRSTAFGGVRFALRQTAYGITATCFAITGVNNNPLNSYTLQLS
ncbi:hypothetical protein, partial [uncultured Desulfovibrio sp.]|uniref:hypothetical protein n=1 Tax=uncultured Desulfovibrio sp. TaxID=167968 RepID=UPI0026186AE1